MFVMKRRTAVFLLVFAVLAASAGGAAATTDTRRDAPASVAATTPDCLLYGVTLAVGVMTQHFDAIKVSKWPLLMAEARKARAAFTDPRLAPVRPRYDDFVRRLGIVGAQLQSGDRSAAYASLTAAKPDLRAVLLAAKRGHVVCKSGGATISIG